MRIEDGTKGRKRGGDDADLTASKQASKPTECVLMCAEGRARAYVLLARGLVKM